MKICSNCRSLDESDVNYTGRSYPICYKKKNKTIQDVHVRPEWCPGWDGVESPMDLESPEPGVYYVQHRDEKPQIGYVFINPEHGYEIRTLDGGEHISIGWKILGPVPEYLCWKLAETDWKLLKMTIFKEGKELDDLKKRISEKLKSRRSMVDTLQTLGGQPTALAEFKARIDELQDLLDGR